MLPLRGLVGGVFAIGMLAFLPGCQRSKKGDLSVQQWNHLVSQNLPRGSSRADVEKFLDQRGIQHSYIAKSNFPDERNSIVAFATSKNDHGVVKNSGIQMKFKFDSDQRLVSSESKEIFTGP
jgi:hypothetical protein